VLSVVDKEERGFSWRLSDTVARGHWLLNRDASRERIYPGEGSCKAVFPEQSVFEVADYFADQSAEDSARR